MSVWFAACTSNGDPAADVFDATPELPLADPGLDPGPTDPGPEPGHSPVGNPRQRLSPLSQEALEFTPSVTPLSLPLSRDDIQNLDYLLDRTGLALTGEAEAALLGRAFVAVPGDKVVSFHSALQWMEDLDWDDGPVPALVASVRPHLQLLRVRPSDERPADRRGLARGSGDHPPDRPAWTDELFR